MTYSELKAEVLIKENEISQLHTEIHDLKDKYVKERLPFPFRRYQRIKLVTEVTEESQKCMSPEWKAKRKNQVGARNQYKGMLVGYIIGKHGDIRPEFWGGKPHYPMGDKIISITVDEVQSPFKCTQCDSCRGHYCYMTGHDEPSFPVDENSFVCGNFCLKE